MRKYIKVLLVVSVLLVMIVGLLQVVGLVQPNVGWNGGRISYILPGGAEPNVGWNGRVADAIIMDQVCFLPVIRPMVGWNG